MRFRGLVGHATVLRAPYFVYRVLRDDLHLCLMASRDHQPAALPSAPVPESMALSPVGVPADQLRSRADLLLKCAEMLHCHVDVSAVVTTLAGRVQELLAVEMVAVLL